MHPDTVTHVRPAYPLAPRLDLVEELAGHRVADPYRWLEDPIDPRTVAWTAEQEDAAQAYWQSLPDHPRWATRLARLLRTDGSVGVPVCRGNLLFTKRREPAQERAVLVVADRHRGVERVLVDPNALDPSGRTTLDTWAPSAEGTRVAYQLSTGGEEQSRLFVADTATGELVDGPIDRCRYSPVAWLPDGEAFCYVRQRAGATGPGPLRRVYLHLVGTDPAADVEIGCAARAPMTAYGLSVSRNGRWLALSARPAAGAPNDVWLVDLRGCHAPLPIQVGVDAQCRAWLGHDDQLYLFTTAGRRVAGSGSWIRTGPTSTPGMT